MRILIAGASGAIGRPLVRRLKANEHEIFALTRAPDPARLKEIGAEPLIADALDSVAVKAAVGRIRPDAVINELTSLPRHYTPAEMKTAAERDHKVRVEGNINLLAALRDAGVRRYLLQSSGFWYAPGAGFANELVPFISNASREFEAALAPTTNWKSAHQRYGESSSSRYATDFLRARNLVHARRRYWRSAAAPADSDYRRGPRRLQLRAHRRCGRGDRRCTGVRARSVQHRRWKPIASAHLAGSVRARRRSAFAASR